MLVVCPRSDIAGVGIGIKRAFDRYSDIEVRQIRRVPRFYDYSYDAEWDDRQALIEWADIVHVMELPGAIPLGKPAVLHHHGSYLRANPSILSADAVHVCSTVDLHGEWVPSPYDLHALAAYRQPSDILTIAHAPTNRTIKGTELFLAACDRLPMPVRVLLIEGVSWSECLRLKGTADIYYDQLGLGYGNNAVEAWAMGIPVIAGAMPDILAEMERRFPLPFYAATEDTLYDALLDLASSRGKRDYWGRRGLEHARRFHEQWMVVKQLGAIYRSLL